MSGGGEYTSVNVFQVALENYVELAFSSSLRFFLFVSIFLVLWVGFLFLMNVHLEFCWLWD